MYKKVVVQAGQHVAGLPISVIALCPGGMVTEVSLHDHKLRLLLSSADPVVTHMTQDPLTFIELDLDVLSKPKSLFGKDLQKTGKSCILYKWHCVQEI